jgi:hypothetical protein
MFGSPPLFGSRIGSDWKHFVQCIQQISPVERQLRKWFFQTVYSNVFNGTSALKSTSL